MNQVMHTHMCFPFVLPTILHLQPQTDTVNLSSLTDGQLVQQVQNGNTSAFEILIKRWQNAIYVFCQRKLKSSEQAEELTQDIFLSAYRGLGNFRQDAQFSTWLFRIASNRCKNKKDYNFRRKTLQHEPLQGLNPENPRDIPDQQPIADQEIEKNERIALLRKGLAQLSESHREILVLFDIQGLSQAEISAILELPTGTIKSRIFRARSELSKTLKSLKNEENL